jgi:hypothetical protein
VTPCFSKSGMRFSRCSRSRIKWMFVVMVEQGSSNNPEREGGEVLTAALFYKGNFRPACFARVRWRPSKVRNSFAPR